MSVNTCSQVNSSSDSISRNAEYAVYSYSVAESEKKGRVWRQHGISNNQDEAFWIAEQLKACEAIERIEIRLQGLDPKTRSLRDKCIKVIDKTNSGFMHKWVLPKMRRLFP
mgnify:CR=1 FL=1